MTVMAVKPNIYDEDDDVDSHKAHMSSYHIKLSLFTCDQGPNSQTILGQS